MEEEFWMQQALALATRGAGRVSPNPLVGAVLVRNGEIIGQGWHEQCGGPHAERNAIRSCSGSPAGATLYVNLEPCCHHGRQPPCTDAILEAARIDGCSRFRSLFSIVLPLSVPAIITSGLVNLVWAWNELMVALVFLQKEHLRTLIVGTTIFKSRYSLNVPVIMAGLVVVTLPMIIVYIFGQKKLVQGLMSGAVKE